MTENNKKKQDEPKKKTSGEESEKEKKLTVEDKLKETEDKLLRSLAEIENQRRRFEKEIKDAFEFGSFNFARESLAILDNLQRAKNAIKNDNILKVNKDLDKFIENINIIEKDLVSIFEKNNIKKIDAEGKKFDPNIHQAMTEIEDQNSDPGTVVQVIQPGYMLGERLLRPALVGVAKKKNAKKKIVRKAVKVKKAGRMIYYFGQTKCDGDGTMRELLGGKGANLAQMVKIGLPVPSGFTITTQTCIDYYANNKKFPAGLEDQILRNLKAIEKETKKGLVTRRIHCF